MNLSPLENTVRPSAYDVKTTIPLIQELHAEAQI